MSSKRKTPAAAPINKTPDSEVPTDNDAVLAALDQLMQSRDCHPFIVGKPDNVNPLVTWNVIGDDERNWLFVVARKQQRRYAMVKAKPKGWPIRGQLFGIDCGTAETAMEMADAISAKYPELS